MVDGVQRLAQFATALEQAGLPYLVMGGHAVRYYGVDRNTIDYDLHLSLDDWDSLPQRLGQSELFAQAIPPEGPSWRPGAFRRFLVGRLDDGREEWLEFWRTNHLLAPFAELLTRHERGRYGDRAVPFLGLSDLIRSKETERGSDWQDVTLLEEIRDARNLARAGSGGDTVGVLAELRSRTGFHQSMSRGLFAVPGPIEQALVRATNPITRAYLRPFVPAAGLALPDSGMIAEVLAGPLRQVASGSARHLALVEAIRRLYRQAAMEADRADKQAALTAIRSSP